MTLDSINVVSLMYWTCNMIQLTQLQTIHLHARAHALVIVTFVEFEYFFRKYLVVIYYQRAYFTLLC